MEKIIADESPKMLGFVQSVTDPAFSDWVLSLNDEYLSTKTAFEIWQEYKSRS